MKYARLFTIAAFTFVFAAFSQVALAAGERISVGWMIDMVGTMDIPEVAMAIFGRAAMFSLLTVSIFLVARRGVRRPVFLVLLLPVIGTIVLVCLFSWKIEYGIARTLILAFDPQVGSVGFFGWPPEWVAPSIGFPVGVLISGILWCRKRCSTNRPTSTANPPVVK